MAAELGARPILCGLIGGETGEVLRTLLEKMPVSCAWSRPLPQAAATSTIAAAASACRSRRARRCRPPATRSTSSSRARSRRRSSAASSPSAAPTPAEALPLEIYGSLVADVKANGARVVVDLSPPRLDSALEGKPDLVKINDWELARYISGPVDTEERMREAAQALLEAGAGAAIITRAGEPAMVLRGERGLGAGAAAL